MNRYIILILVSFFSVSSLAVEKVQIVIETEILNPDPQAGMKSRQVVQVYFVRKEIKNAFETGTTDFFGEDLTSVRNNFKVLHTHFSNDIATFEVKGETASGVHIMPNINYRFEFKVKKGGETKISGCHDGYPAYRIYVNGVEKYIHKHKSIDLLSLFGECDIKLPQ